jgi:hypothetical protein
MGLDALVYKNKKHLPFDAEALGAAYDADTGEYYFEDAELEQKYPPDLCVAIAKPLGNLHVIARLRDELTGALAEDSVVHAKILYSGTHTGDWLPLSALGDVEAELFVIEQFLAGRKSRLLDEFIANMRELMAAARREENPIVF